MTAIINLIGPVAVWAIQAFGPYAVAVASLFVFVYAAKMVQKHWHELRKPERTPDGLPVRFYDEGRV